MANKLKTMKARDYFWLLFSGIGIFLTSWFIIKWLSLGKVMFATVIIIIAIFLVIEISAFLCTAIDQTKIPTHAKVVCFIIIGCAALYLVFNNIDGKVESILVFYEQLTQ